MNATSGDQRSPLPGHRSPLPDQRSPLPPDGPAHRWRRLAGLAWLPAAALLFLCYLRISRTEPANSDSAANVLQAWDMLHGNLLLHGWWLSDVSFFTTELPEYVLVDWVRGLSPDVVHVAAALTYTILVVLGGLLAKGRATGKAAVVRILIAAGIMLAPQPGTAVSTLLLAPDHVGSAAPVLLLFLLLDRARPRWYVPVLAGLLLTWALVGDALILVTAVLPLVTVSGWRACAGMLRRGEPRSSWFDLALIGAALTAAGASRALLAWISASGGFTMHGVQAAPVSIDVFWRNMVAIPRGVLVLYGAGFSGHAPFAIAAAAVHLAGVALAVWALATVARRFRPDGDRVDQLLAAALVVNLLATALLINATANGREREYAAVLPLGAVLAARVLGPRIASSARLTGGLAAVLAGYVLGLASAMTVPTVPADDAQLTPWLAAHHLDYGVAGYWNASIVTLTSGQRIHIVSWKVRNRGSRFFVHRWEAERSWYNPRLHDANFAVFQTRQRRQERLALAAFGPPSRSYQVGGDLVVLVWHENLLAKLG